MWCDMKHECAVRRCLWGLGFFIRMAGKIAGHLLRTSAKTPAVGILNNNTADKQRVWDVKLGV